jgi:hypothetical protein
MTFDEAYKKMREGAAIARPGWKKIRYLFWSHGYVRALHYSGQITMIGIFSGPQEDEDWFVVDIIPAQLDPPKSHRTRSDRVYFGGAKLAALQAEMKSRYPKSRAQ